MFIRVMAFIHVMSRCELCEVRDVPVRKTFTRQFLDLLSMRPLPPRPHPSASSASLISNLIQSNRDAQLLIQSCLFLEWFALKGKVPCLSLAITE